MLNANVGEQIHLHLFSDDVCDGDHKDSEHGSPGGRTTLHLQYKAETRPRFEIAGAKGFLYFEDNVFTVVSFRPAPPGNI